MRRTLFSLLAAAAIAASYGVYWYSLAELVRRGILDWSAARREEGFTVGWDHYEVGGFPLALRVTIAQPIFGQSGVEPGYSARGPQLVAEARPWALDEWRLSAAEGARLDIAPGPARPAITVEAATFGGTVARHAENAAAGNAGTEVTLRADSIAVSGQAELAIVHAAAHAVLPVHGAVSHLETWSSASLQLANVRLPVAVPPLGNTIDHLAVAAAVKGSIASGPHRAALAAWRDDGGTLEIESLDLDWGDLAFAAKGTLALDAALQPVGALTATIRGYNEIVDALVASDGMRPGDAALAKLALGILAKQRADGTYEIAAPLTLQNGYAYLGPARLARLPAFTWE
jgi:hypothetical protein